MKHPSMPEIEDMKVRLSEMRTQMETMKEKATLLKAKSRIEYLEQLNELENRYGEVREEVDRLTKKGKSSGEALGEGLEKAWYDLDLAFAEARERLRKNRS